MCNLFRLVDGDIPFLLLTNIFTLLCTIITSDCRKIYIQKRLNTIYF